MLYFDCSVVGESFSQTLIQLILTLFTVLQGQIQGGGGGGLGGLPPPSWARPGICFNSKLLVSIHPKVLNGQNHVNNIRGASITLLELGVTA